jgi:hypothetical protein
MIRDRRTRGRSGVKGGVQSGPKLPSEFSGLELQLISFCYTASGNSAGQITDLRATPLLIEKPE